MADNLTSQVKFEGEETTNIPGSLVPRLGLNQDIPEDSYAVFAQLQNPGCNGKEIYTLFHVPTETLNSQPSSNLTTTISLQNSSFEVPTSQVVPAYTADASPNFVIAASASDVDTLAKYLVVERNGDNVEIASSGPYTVEGGHNYIVGRQYYLSNLTGQVATNAGDNSQPIFYVASSDVLIINIGQ